MSETPKLTEEQITRAAYDFAAGMMRRGHSALKVEEELVKKGLSKADASAIANKLADALTKAYRDAARVAAQRQMALGGLICIIGIAITLCTYSAASSSSTGGSVIVAWGAIIFGAYRFYRGWSNLP